MGQGSRYFATSRNTYTGHFYYGHIIVYLFFFFIFSMQFFLSVGEMNGQGRLK